MILCLATGTTRVARLNNLLNPTSRNRPNPFLLALEPRGHGSAVDSVEEPSIFGAMADACDKPQRLSKAEAIKQFKSLERVNKTRRMQLNGAFRPIRSL